MTWGLWGVGVRTGNLPPRTYVKEVDPFDWSDEADRGAALFHEDHPEPLSGMAWRNGGELAMIATPDEHQRKGYARELFNYVQQHIDPSLHHSDHLTDDGAAWRKSMEAGSPGPGERTAHRTAMPWYHNTDAELNPGDALKPASELGVDPRWNSGLGYDPNFVYMYHSDADPIPAENQSYGKNTYEVHPVGQVERDPEWERNKEDFLENLDDEDDFHEQEIPGYFDHRAPGAQVIRKIEPKEARIMSAAVTVYTQPNCIQCTMTKKQLDKLGIEHTTVDVSQDPDAHAYVTGLGYTAAPVVVINNGEDHWAGFKPDRLKELSGE